MTEDRFNDFDLEVRSLMENAREEVPSRVWDSISGSLDRIETRRKTVSMWWKRTAAGIPAAAVFSVSAGSFFVISAGVTLAVMVTVCSGVDQFTPQIGFHCLISTSGRPGTQLDSLLFQCCLCAAADSAADQDIDSLAGQKPGQRPVTAPVGADHLGRDHTAVLDLIYLEFFRVSEMLENVTVVICYCNSHAMFRPYLYFVL